MKKVLPLVALLAAWALVLTWCNKTENVEEVVEETGAVEETNLKTSLDLGELIGLIENHFPKSYEYSQFSIADNLIGEEGNHVYNKSERGYILPEYHMADREVVSSWIEDGMIKTLVNATTDDGKQIDITFVVNPETLDFVAANVVDGDLITNYQFNYDNITSLSLADIEFIAETDFPTSSTYTKVVIETEESNTWVVVYPEDNPHNLANITPDFPKIDNAKLLSSGIEDGMIYTNFDVEFDNGTTGNVLYINNPETLDFVATTVESQGYYINYQYVY